MTHDEAFLQAILEAPEDETPRLVYADWLEDQGDPRGEFIRLQAQLARLAPDDPDRPALEEHLAREGFDERYGARPLQRTLESVVVTPLARHLLEHPEVRNTPVFLDYEGGRLVIRTSAGGGPR